MHGRIQAGVIVPRHRNCRIGVLLRHPLQFRVDLLRLRKAVGVGVVVVVDIPVDIPLMRRFVLEQRPLERIVVSEIDDVVILQIILILPVQRLFPACHRVIRNPCVNIRNDGIEILHIVVDDAFLKPDGIGKERKTIVADHLDAGTVVETASFDMPVCKQRVDAHDPDVCAVGQIKGLISEIGRPQRGRQTVSLRSAGITVGQQKIQSRIQSTRAVVADGNRRPVAVYPKIAACKRVRTGGILRRAVRAARPADPDLRIGCRFRIRNNREIRAGIAADLAPEILRQIPFRLAAVGGEHQTVVGKRFSKQRTARLQVLRIAQKQRGIRQRYADFPLPVPRGERFGHGAEPVLHRFSDGVGIVAANIDMRARGPDRVSVIGQIAVDFRVRPLGLSDDDARAGFRRVLPPGERERNAVFFKQFILQVLRIGKVIRIPAENGILRLSVADQRNRSSRLGLLGHRLPGGGIGRGGVRPVSPVFRFPACGQQQKSRKKQSKESFHVRYLF